MSPPFDEEFVIKQIMNELKELHRAVESVRIEMAALKIKSGIWGLAAGLIPAIGVILMYVLSKI